MQPMKPNTVRNVQPRGHDPYARRTKTADAIVCGQCGVVFHGGRWYWGTPPLCDERSGLCPACERIRDRYPAGRVRLSGLADAEREEVIHMIRNLELSEKREHPLERLIEVVDGDDGDVLITTTGTHLARRIASGLRRRARQDVEIRFAEGDHFVDVVYRG